MKSEITEIITENEEETRALGRSIGSGLKAGDRVGISGVLGAGKTVLARGICEGLGVPAHFVSSPTFAIVNTYSGLFPVFHADFYRVSDMEEIEATGILDIAHLGVLLVEWVDRVPEFFETGIMKIDIQDNGGMIRKISINRLFSVNE